MRLVPEVSLLEVGCRTGIATLPLADRSFAITCIELGASLTAAVKENLSPFANVRI
ncbi:MAG: hypothetical protein QF515_06630 [Pseudomonadales bacterium]|jgi:16S rRNA A1518/A1519 N6-dimethyltransferase RsmA/KsgA/DIM1 with predicted DNA glycosylase/AP lyase activity|nr:hypothetical protein [Pseudomonadales bacterium]|tara:strand:- start:956 stop:1123 length:168 start_codon:yes stop_codon:yes gene_type:complete